MPQLKTLNSSPLIPIGTQAASRFWQSEQKVSLQAAGSSTSRDRALQLAAQTPGADMIVESRAKDGQRQFDVYSFSVQTRPGSFSSLPQADAVKLVDKPLDRIAASTGRAALRGFMVSASGQVGGNIYPSQFEATRYERARQSLNLDQSPLWDKVVNKILSGSSEADDLPPIENAEIQHMKSRLQPGDILMNGNNGSFIHGILYVGQDAELQAQLEAQWQLPPGSLKGEGLIIHALASDSSKTLEGPDGRKQFLASGGTGVILDTIERYNQRHPRDVMLAVSVKDASAAERRAVVEEAKKMIGKPYDYSFNTVDDARMYCTEVVMKSWLASSKPPAFENQLHPLASLPTFVMDKMPAALASRFQDGGFLRQEMVMTDGLATSPDVDLVWASQNADRSAFAQKHARWSESADAPEVRQQLGEIGTYSQGMLSQIERLAAETRTALKP